eukprot:446765_1
MAQKQMELSSELNVTNEKKDNETDEKEEKEKEKNDNSVYVFACYMKTISLHPPEPEDKGAPQSRNISIIPFSNWETIFNVDLDEKMNGIIDDYCMQLFESEDDLEVDFSRRNYKPMWDIKYTLDRFGESTQLSLGLKAIKINTIYKNEQFPLKMGGDSCSIFGDYCLNKYDSKEQYFHALYNNTSVCGAATNGLKKYLNATDTSDRTNSVNSGHLYYKLSSHSSQLSEDNPIIIHK